MGVRRLDQISDHVGMVLRDVESFPRIDGEIEQQRRVVDDPRLIAVVGAAGDEVRLVATFADSPQLAIPVVIELVAGASSPW